MEQKRELPLEVVEAAMQSRDCDVRAAAMEACKGRDVPLSVLETGLRDSDCDVRAAAMEACKGRDVPLSVLETWLRDGDWCVRAAAMEACKERGLPIPVIRTFEPPECVYKKCLNGVIVVAEIPVDAQVRGRPGQKCRANKAVIKEIIGDFFGEPVGISSYDRTTMYYAGDVVEVEDFDYSNEECSTGFHFFCTIEEAKNYE